MLTLAAGSLKTETKTFNCADRLHKSPFMLYFFSKIYGGECSLIDYGSRMSSARPVDDDPSFAPVSF